MIIAGLLFGGMFHVIALLIDADNLSAKLAATILDWCRSKGPILAVRVFGSFEANRNADWCEIARDCGFELVFQPNGGTGKNSTDIALTIHAMDLLQEAVVTAFCLASNDRDFVPLATRLRRSGRRVFAVGERLDDRVKSNCHDFLQIATAPKPVKLPDVPPIVAAFRQVAKNSSSMPLGQLAQLLRAHAPHIVPTGAGRLRRSLNASGWFEEEGEGNALVIRLKRSAA